MCLWNGNDTSLSAPVTTQYMGDRSDTARRPDDNHRNDRFDRGRTQVRCGADGGQQRFYVGNGYLRQPVLLDLIDRR